MRTKTIWIIHISLILLCGCKNEQPPTGPPNIIYILADDLGIGDLSCYNEQSKIKTTHLDRLAARGMLFTDAHSGSAVCTPTRYGILTGRYAWRTSLQRGVTWTLSPPLIDKNRMTVADLLKKHGYHTACIGKWHLGLGWAKDSTDQVNFSLPIEEGPNDVGFDYFYGITASLDIPPYFYIENNKITATAIDTVGAMSGKKFWRKSPIGNDFNMAEVLPNLLQKSLDYIDQQVQFDNPFFLYFPLTAPHTPIIPTTPFMGKSGTNEYGDFVLMVDDLVGQIVEKLEVQNALDNTLIVFTSDNGCSPMANFEELQGLGHHPSYIYRGHKADIFEGGHRVPFIVQWPKNIPGGIKSDATICLTDFMKTCASIVKDSLDAKSGEDSFDLSSILMGEDGSFSRTSTVHHSINGSFSLRKDDWKLIFCPGSGGWSAPLPQDAISQNLPPIQLYNLKEDPGETRNLADDYPEQVELLTKIMTEYIENGRSTKGPTMQNDVAVHLFPQKPKQ